MDPHRKLGELRHRGAHVHHIAAEAIELGDDQHVAGFQPVERVKPRRCEVATFPDTVSVTTRRGSTLKPAALISCSWLSVVWPAADSHRPAGNAAAATRQSSNPARSAAFADASHHEAVDLAVSSVEFAVDLADLTVCLARLSVDDIIDGGEIAMRA